MERFTRTRLLMGQDSWERMAARRVTVVGLGAVGSYATEALVRSGVGSQTGSLLRLIDFDTVSESNINRQLFALESTLAQPKTEAAVARVRDINPDCQVEAMDCFVHRDSLPAVLDNQPDLVIDAIDSLTPKALLLEHLYKACIPVLSSMGAALRTDPQQICIGDVMDTHGCPLARAIRLRLRKLQVGRGIRCVYSTEHVRFDYAAAGTDGQIRNSRRGLERNVLGSLATMTGIFGLTLANEALKLLQSV